MKENDIVSLLNLKEEYINKNLYYNVSGVVLKIINYEKSLILFLNDKIVGDYAVVQVDNKDIKKANVVLPMNFVYELKNSKKLNKENLFNKQSFKKLDYNECDYVELIVEDEKYTKFGIHKGETGVIAMDYAVDDYILVDFSGIDKNEDYYGDCIAVKIADLKVIK